MYTMDKHTMSRDAMKPWKQTNGRMQLSKLTEYPVEDDVKRPNFHV